jgi:hypothetical protein
MSEGHKSLSRFSPIIIVLVALALLVLIALILFLVPFAYTHYERRWYWHKLRNNPPCVYEEDCFLTNCPRPNGTRCLWHPELRKGVCSCEPGGLKPEDIGWDLDAGGGGGPLPRETTGTPPR